MCYFTEEQTLQVFENRVFWKTFGPNKDEDSNLGRFYMKMNLRDL
jgi:hypothetical protein